MKIPAGLFDESFELFTYEGKVYCIAEGKKWNFPFLPHWVTQIVNEDLKGNTEALNALKNFGLTDWIAQLEMYIKCCFGGFDGEADFVDGKMVHNEYFDCGQRGKCPYEGKICNSIVHKFNISFRQVQIINQIRLGKQDKEIADKLFISTTTVSKQVRNILQKTELSNRSEIVRWATDHNISLNT